MNASEVREMSVAELRVRIYLEKNNLDTMKLKHAACALQDAQQIRKTRQDIARMITILAEKEKQQN